jgi:hypothetical protein
MQGTYSCGIRSCVPVAIPGSYRDLMQENEDGHVDCEPDSRVLLVYHVLELLQHRVSQGVKQPHEVQVVELGNNHAGNGHLPE